MDPQATLYEIADAIHDQDRERLADALDALAHWSGNGGFLPTVSRIDSSETGAYIISRNAPR